MAESRDAACHPRAFSDRPRIFTGAPRLSDFGLGGTFRKTLIILCFLVGLTTAGTSWLAKDAGSQAHAALGTEIAPDVQTKIAAHGGAAVRVWWLTLSACGILLLACFGNKVWKAIARCLFFLGSVALAAYIGYVADLGGRLVYVDEVGVGVHPMNAPAPAAESPSTPSTHRPHLRHRSARLLRQRRFQLPHLQKQPPHLHRLRWKIKRN